MNGNSVGLDTQKRTLECPSAWLMGRGLIVEFSTPKSGAWGGPELACWADEEKKLILGTVWGGGINRILCPSGP